MLWKCGKNATGESNCGWLAEPTYRQTKLIRAMRAHSSSNARGEVHRHFHFFNLSF